MLKNCNINLIDIIKRIYEDTKYLERTKLPTQVEEIYQPLEDLSNCEYFQKKIEDFSAQDVKVISVVFIQGTQFSDIFYSLQGFLQFIPVFSIAIFASIVPYSSL